MARKKKTAAALTAVSMVRLLTWQSAPSHPHLSLMYTLLTSFPPKLGFDVSPSEKRGEGSGCLHSCHGAYFGWVVCRLSFRPFWTHRVNDFSLFLSWPPSLSCPSVFVFAIGSEVISMFDFVSPSVSPPSVTLSGHQYTPPPAPVSMCWSLFLLSEVAGKDLMAQIWDEQTVK